MSLFSNSLSLSSQDNGLQGRIGTEFGRFQHLHKLYLQNNKLGGGIEAVQWLTSLRRLNLENNQLTGTLPYDVGKLKHLEEGQLVQLLAAFCLLANLLSFASFCPQCGWGRIRSAAPFLRLCSGRTR